MQIGGRGQSLEISSRFEHRVQCCLSEQSYDRGLLHHYFRA